MKSSRRGDQRSDVREYGHERGDLMKSGRLVSQVRESGNGVSPDATMHVEVRRVALASPTHRIQETDWTQPPAGL